MRNAFIELLSILFVSAICSCGNRPTSETSVTDPAIGLKEILSGYEDSISKFAEEKDIVDSFFYSIRFKETDSMLLMDVLGYYYTPIFIPMFGPASVEKEYYKEHGHENNHLYGYMWMENNRCLFIHESEHVDSLVKLFFPGSIIKHDEEYLNWYDCSMIDVPSYTYSVDKNLNFQFVTKDF